MRGVRDCICKTQPALQASHRSSQHSRTVLLCQDVDSIDTFLEFVYGLTTFVVMDSSPTLDPAHVSPNDTQVVPIEADQHPVLDSGDPQILDQRYLHPQERYPLQSPHGPQAQRQSQGSSHSQPQKSPRHEYQTSQQSSDQVKSLYHFTNSPQALGPNVTFQSTKASGVYQSHTQDPMHARGQSSIASPAESTSIPTRYRSPETSSVNQPIQCADASSILTIEPMDEPAKIAFDILVKRMKDEQIDPHHARYIVVSGTKDVLTAGGYVSSETDRSDRLECDVNDSTRYVGFYRIGFDTPPLSRGPRWTIGRGSTSAENGKAQSGAKSVATSDRSIDILLAFPHVPRAIKLHRMHAIIRLHPGSGAWMLAAGTSCKDRKDMTVGQRPSMETCSHEVIRLDNKPLRHFEEQCLSRAQSTLSIGGMTFSIQFCVNNTTQEESYLRLRNEFLKATLNLWSYQQDIRHSLSIGLS